MASLPDTGSRTTLLAGGDVPSFRTRKLLILVLITGLAIVLGTVLRLHNVSERTMSHVEMFVPGIPLPAGLSVPPPRLDLQNVVSRTITDDTHPPGFYIFMWFVTKLFGSGTFALRFPSILLGAASIGLVFWLGILIGEPVAGCIAAVFLALNGYNIVWSETARMYAPICFLGLVTTIQLVLLARSTRPRRLLEAGYAVAMLSGLASHHFFWGFLATQMAWVLVNAWTQNRPMPRLLNLQILVMIVGSPLLAVAAYQSGNQVAFLSRDVALIMREFIQFVYLFPGWDDTYAPGGQQALALAPQFAIPLFVFFLLCLWLLITGILRLKPDRERTPIKPAKSFLWAWLLAAVVMSGLLLMYCVVEIRHSPRHKPTLKYVEVMTVVPILMAVAAAALQKSWDRLRGWTSGLPLNFLEGSRPLVLMMAFIPFLLLSALSILFRPVMDPRGLLYLSPYLLLTLACGVVTIGHRSVWLAASLFLVLGALHAFSVVAYRDRTVSPVDFGQFAARLEPQLRPTDIVFFRKDWDTTPILYYLKTSQYHLVASNVSKPADYPADRIWVLLFHGEEFPRGVKDALVQYHEGGKVDVYLASAVLYCRDSCQ